MRRRRSADQQKQRPTLPKPPQCGRCGTTVASKDITLCSACQQIEDAKAPAPMFRTDMDLQRPRPTIEGEGAGHPLRT